MTKHIRANLLLLAFTAILCCGLYPLLLFAVARGLFPASASGSLLTAGEEIRGSRLIAQPFTADEYFWPRPSAASYNAAASGASNWGASNPKLRDRVAQQLGPMVQYKTGSKSAGTGPSPRTPQQDIEAWFAAQPARAEPLPAGVPVSAVAFDAWVSDPANQEKAADLEPAIADMVMASGSGLDPHITLRNALSVYQIDRIAAKRTPPGADVKKVREDIAALARKLSFSPLGGLAGEPLVNVLELNLTLDRDFPLPPAKTP